MSACFDLYINEYVSIQKEYRGFKVIDKRDSWFSKVIRAILFVLSFGKLDYFEFYSIIGKTLYAGTRWNSLTWLEKYLILCHERIHLEQTKRCFFGIFWIGFVIFSITYIFLPFPTGITFRGFLFEKEAYQETIRKSKEHGIGLDIDYITDLFCGPKYIWMFPFRSTVKKWMNESSRK
jgi:hypothetical protein